MKAGAAAPARIGASTVRSDVKRAIAWPVRAATTACPAMGADDLHPTPSIGGTANVGGPTLSKALGS